MIGDLALDLDEGAGFVLVVLGLLFTVIFGAGLFPIYSSSTILSEAAFEFLLAGTLIKSSKKMDDPDWMGSVLRATWVPFALVLVLSLTAGRLLHHHFPEVVKISEVFKG